MHLDSRKRQLLNDLFRINRRVMKAYLLKESLDRLWTYTYEGAALRYLNGWIDQLRWQRLEPFQKLAESLLRRGNPQLLPGQGSLGRRGRGQRQCHSSVATR